MSVAKRTIEEILEEDTLRNMVLHLSEIMDEDPEITHDDYWFIEAMLEKLDASTSLRRDLRPDERTNLERLWERCEPYYEFFQKRFNEACG